MTKLGGHMKGVALSAFKELLPSMQGGAKAMDEWVKVNREWIKVEIVAVVRDFVSMAKAAYKIINDSVVPAIKSLLPYWRGFEDIVGKGNARLLLFTAVVAPGIIGAVLGIGKAFLGLGLTLAANPLAAGILAIVAVLAFAAYKIWQNWDDIKAGFVEGLATVQSTWERGIAGIKELGRVASEEWFEVKWSDIEAEVRAGWTSVKATWAVLAGNVAQAGRDLWNSLPDDMGQVILDIGAMIGSKAGAFKDAMVNAFLSPIQTIKDLWAGLLSTIESGWNFLTGLFGRKLPTPEVAGSDTGGAWVGVDVRDRRPRIATPAATRRPKSRSDRWRLGRRREYAEAGRRLRWRLGRTENAQIAAGPRALATTAQAQKSETKVEVNIKGLPPGSTVSERSTGSADVRLNAGYAGRARDGRSLLMSGSLIGLAARTFARGIGLADASGSFRGATIPAR